MTVYERAWQIWPCLVLCATKRQLLSYPELSKLISVPQPGLGQLLEPIQSYCLIDKHPPLTSIVVGDNSGVPGEGFIAAQDVPSAQAKAFKYDWSQVSPTPEQFQQALTRLPTNGRQLSELLQTLGNRE